MTLPRICTSRAFSARSYEWRLRDMLSTLLLIILILLIIGAAPAWPHSRSWGYAPSGLLGTLLIIVLLLAVLGRI